MQLKILRLIDVFGVEVGLKYEGRYKYTSRIGGFITLVVGCILCSLLYQQCSQMYNKQNSTSFYQQTYVDIPSRYDLSSNKFAFMIGLLDKNNMPIIDNTIYTLSAILMQKVLSDPSTPGKYTFVNTPLSIGACTIDDFRMTEVQSYFLLQSFEQLYCLKNQSEIYLQGQFDKEVFSQVRIQVLECSNSTSCKSPSERQSLIKTSTIQIYYTDRILELQNFDTPFKVVGKTQFYNIFYDYTLSTDFVFSNTHIIDDTGLLIESTNTSTELVFVQDRYQLVAKASNEIFEINLYLEKDKEDTYIRKYMKIPELLSQLSGTFQALFFIGYIFLRPYNNSKLQERLYKDIYSKENQEKNRDNILLQSTQKSLIFPKKCVQNIINNQNDDTSSKRQQNHPSYLSQCLKRVKQRFNKNDTEDSRSSQEMQANQLDIQNKEEELKQCESPSHSQNLNTFEIQKNQKKLSIFKRCFLIFKTKNIDPDIKQKKILLEKLRSLKQIINTQTQLHNIFKNMKINNFDYLDKSNRGNYSIKFINQQEMEKNLSKEETQKVNSLELIPQLKSVNSSQYFINNNININSNNNINNSKNINNKETTKKQMKINSNRFINFKQNNLKSNESHLFQDKSSHDNYYVSNKSISQNNIQSGFKMLTKGQENNSQYKHYLSDQSHHDNEKTDVIQNYNDFQDKELDSNEHSSILNLNSYNKQFISIKNLNDQYFANLKVQSNNVSGVIN